MGRVKRLSDQYGHTYGASLFGIPQPMARGTCLPHSQIEDRDTPDVPLHTQAHRGPCVHLLRGAESLQGTGTHAEGIRHQDERRQGARIGQDHHHNTNQAPIKQGCLHQNHADGKASAHRQTLRRRLLGDAMTKSGG